MSKVRKRTVAHVDHAIEWRQEIRQLLGEENPPNPLANRS